MELSKVSAQFTESVIREMTRVSREHPGTINLAQGFPDFPAPHKIKQAAVEAIMHDINQYAITWGAEHLRKGIARKAAEYNKIPWVAHDKNVVVTCGSTEAMISSLKAIINPGDEVIIFTPQYENYKADCLLSGAKPRHIRLKSPEWNFDFEELKSLFNEKTKAIIINTPNNPTGKVYSEEELKFIADLCIEHDVIAITDEIYEHIIYDGYKHISIASLPGMEENSITINSVSKTYSLTGWRVGWTIASERITREIKKVHDFLTVGAAAPLQEASITALKMPEEYYMELNDFYQESRDLLFNALKKAGLNPILPHGAYYIMCNCKEYMSKYKIENSMDLAMDLIKRVGIATVPGFSFYTDPDDGKYQTRFTFCKKRETLDAAIKKLEKIS